MAEATPAGRLAEKLHPFSRKLIALFDFLKSSLESRVRGHQDVRLYAHSLPVVSRDGIDAFRRHGPQDKMRVYRQVFEWVRAAA